MWFFGLIVVLLIGAVAVVASGRWGAMAPAYDDRPDLTVPARQALTADDLETARFGVGLRGYRMDEVDTLLERVAREVAERDRRIADLERAVSPIIHGPEGAGFTARADYEPADFDDTGYNLPILVGGDFPTPEEDEKVVAEAPVATQPPAEPQPEQPAQPTAATPAEAPPAPAATDVPAVPAATDV
ncbi:DivIVA domain-containing protein, partial [Kribbella koreensis]